MSAVALDRPHAAEIADLLAHESPLRTKHGGILFYGSSSFRLWTTLGKDFPGIDIVNRAFGGSTLEQCVKEMPLLVYPLRPRVLVMYAGDNDLDEGASPEEVLASFEAFVLGVRQHLGSIPVAFLSIKPSPLRQSNLHNIRRANELIRAAAVRTGITFIDVFPLMIDEGGKPRAELFQEDTLHLNASGYAMWKTVLGEYLRAVAGQ